MGWRAAHLSGLIGNSRGETPATSWVNVVFERMPLIHPAFMAIWNHNSTQAVERLYWIRMKGKIGSNQHARNYYAAMGKRETKRK